MQSGFYNDEKRKQASNSLETSKKQKLETRYDGK